MESVIIGSTGQLGHALLTQMQRERISVTGLCHADLDICDEQRAREVLQGIRPRLLINTAAYNQVDAAESDAAEAFAVNALAVRHLARICHELGATFVHFSTDFVFDGASSHPYSEDTAPNPLSVYATSKLAGEYFARTYCARHLVVRSCGLYGSRPSPRQPISFVETMLRLAAQDRPIRVVADQVVTPTFVRDLAAAVLGILSREGEVPSSDYYGIYHITNGGHCSWYDFAAAIFAESGLNVDLQPTTGAAYGAPARRPPYSVLARQRLLRLGLPGMRPWREALREYLGERRPIEDAG